MYKNKLIEAAWHSMTCQYRSGKTIIFTAKVSFTLTDLISIMKLKNHTCYGVRLYSLSPVVIEKKINTSVTNKRERR